MIFAGFHPENLSHHFSCVSPLRPFETQVQQMSQAQAQDFLVQLYQQMMVQENLYKDLIKEWGIELAVPTWEPASVNLLIASSIQNWGLGDFKSLSELAIFPNVKFARSVFLVKQRVSVEVREDLSLRKRAT